MKFYSGFILALLAASASVKAAEETEKLGGLGDSIDLSSLGGDASSNSEALKCTATLAIYSACAEDLSSMASGEIKDVCPIIESEKCKDFLKDIDEQNADCAKGMPEVNILIDSIRYLYFSTCIKDEKGNLCPYQKTVNEKVIQSMKTNSTETNVKESEELLLKSIDESCYSEQCVHGIKKSFEIIKSLSATSTNSTESLTGDFDAKEIEALENKVNSCKVNKAGSESNGASSRLAQWSGLYIIAALSLLFIKYF